MNSKAFALPVLKALPTDNISAISVLCGEFESMTNGAIVTPPTPEKHDDFVEALSILKAFCQQRGIGLENIPEIGSDATSNVKRIAHVFNFYKQWSGAELKKRHAEGLLASKTDEYAALFSNSPVYEFSDSDFSRLQVLINELRDEIRRSTLISDDHKTRLLKRLEAMQQELHKRTSDIDRFWGFIGEAGITIRKFGEDIKPVTERVQELGRIVIAVIFAKEGIKALPEVSKILLPDK